MALPFFPSLRLDSGLCQIRVSRYGKINIIKVVEEH